MSNDKEKKSEKEDQQAGAGEDKKAPTLLVWTVRGLSLLLIFSILGYLTWSAMRAREEPRFVYELHLDKCAERDGRWVLPVTVTNEGTVSAHDLTAAVSVNGPDGRSEQQITFPMIGAREELTLEFWYDEDPRGKKIRATTISYLVP